MIAPAFLTPLPLRFDRPGSCRLLSPRHHTIDARSTFRACQASSAGSPADPLEPLQPKRSEQSCGSRNKPSKVLSDSEYFSLAQDAESLAASWISRAEAGATTRERVSFSRLARLATDAHSSLFAMRFVDRVARAATDSVAARQLAAVVRAQGRVPDFLGVPDKIMLKVGAELGKILPALVVPAARMRMRSLVGGLVVGAEEKEFGIFARKMRREGYAQNVNLLGEMVLGEEEAEKRLQKAIALIKGEHVEYVSVKISGLTSQINPWDYEGSLFRIEKQLTRLWEASVAGSSRTFINVDMEAYDELELSVDAFMNVLGRDKFVDVDAGIVVQAYLPDALPTIQRLVAWSNERFDRGCGGQIKIRLVKGANLAMERVTASMRGWNQ